MNLIQYTIKDSEEMKKIIILDKCSLELEKEGLDNNSIRYLIEKEKVLDHIILGDNGNYLSMLEENLM